MKIKWLKSGNITLYYGEGKEVISPVKDGDIEEVTLLYDTEVDKGFNMQFGDGGVAFGINRDFFKVLSTYTGRKATKTFTAYGVTHDEAVEKLMFDINEFVKTEGFDVETEGIDTRVEGIAPFELE